MSTALVLRQSGLEWAHRRAAVPVREPLPEHVVVLRVDQRRATELSRRGSACGDRFGAAAAPEVAACRSPSGMVPGKLWPPPVRGPPPDAGEPFDLVRSPGAVERHRSTRPLPAVIRPSWRTIAACCGAGVRGGLPRPSRSVGRFAWLVPRVIRLEPATCSSGIRSRPATGGRSTRRADPGRTAPTPRRRGFGRPSRRRGRPTCSFACPRSRSCRRWRR